MIYEVAASEYEVGEYVAESIGEDGEVYVVTFSGPRSQERAHHFARLETKTEKLREALVSVEGAISLATPSLLAQSLSNMVRAALDDDST